MESILKKLDSFFVDGFIESSLKIGVVIIFLLIINRFLTFYINKKYPVNNQFKLNVKRWILYVIAFITIISQISILSLLTKTLLASGGIIAVIVGLASQEAGSALIGGLMITVFKPFKIGDYVVLPNENIRGNVINITLRHTVIETIEKTHMIIPNTTMNDTIIENVSNIENKKANALYFDISYDSDIDKAIDIIKESVIAHPLFQDGRSDEDKLNNVPKVNVYVTALKDSSIQLRAMVYSNNISEGFIMLSDLRKTILQKFNQNNIIVPYPHLVIKDETK